MAWAVYDTGMICQDSTIGRGPARPPAREWTVRQPPRCGDSRDEYGWIQLAESGRARADGRSDRPPVPPALPAARCRSDRIGDGDERPAPAHQCEDDAPHRPRWGACAQVGPDCRRGPGAPRRRGAIQRRPWRRYHRHQHGLPGQEGVQRGGGIGATVRRGARRAHPRARGRGGRGAGHPENPHRTGSGSAQRGADRAHRGGSRRRRRRRARQNATVRVQGTRRIRFDPCGQASGLDRVYVRFVLD